jgi:hypothetical protein
MQPEPKRRRSVRILRGRYSPSGANALTTIFPEIFEDGSESTPLASPAEFWELGEAVPFSLFVFAEDLRACVAPSLPAPQLSESSDDNGESDTTEKARAGNGDTGPSSPALTTFSPDSDILTEIILPIVRASPQGFFARTLCGAATNPYLIGIVVGLLLVPSGRERPQHLDVATLRRSTVELVDIVEATGIRHVAPFFP